MSLFNKIKHNLETCAVLRCSTIEVSGGNKIICNQFFTYSEFKGAITSYHALFLSLGLPEVDDKMKWHCNWILVFWITFPGQSLQDFEVTLIFKLVAPEIHSYRIIVGLLSFTSAPSIHQAYVSDHIQYSGYNTFLLLPKYCCLFSTNCFGFFFFFFFCTKTIRTIVTILLHSERQPENI